MLRLMIVAALAASAAPALARPATEKKPADPNRMICRTQEVIGSRLQTTKTCMTAMQWDQVEREQRFTVDRVQAFKPNNGN